MIRLATREDIPVVASIAQKFYLSAVAETCPWEVAVAVITDCLENGVLLVSDSDGVQGLLAGRFIENPLIRSRVLQEVCWYSKDNSGIALLRAFIAEGRKREADTVYLAVLESAGERVHRLLPKLGLAPMERGYTMKL